MDTSTLKQNNANDPDVILKDPINTADASLPKAKENNFY